MPPNELNQSTPPANPDPQIFSAPSPQPKSGMSRTLLSAIVIIAVLALGAGAFAYFKNTQSAERPDAIIQKMISRMTEIKSLEYSGEIKVEADAEDLLAKPEDLSEPEQLDSDGKAKNFLLLNFTGLSDIHDLNNPRGSFYLNINTDALEGKNSTIQMEIKVTDKMGYLKLGSIPDLGFFDLNKVKNQWVTIPIKEMKDQAKGMTGEQELTPEQLEKLKITIKQNKIFKITESLAGETIEGIDTYHYKFAIDKKEIKNLLNDINKIVRDKTFTEEELAEFDEGSEAIELSPGEIWIGKTDLLPYKMSLSSTIKQINAPEKVAIINFTLSLKNFNKPVQIEIPTQTKTLEEIMRILFGESKGIKL